MRFQLNNQWIRRVLPNGKLHSFVSWLRFYQEEDEDWRSNVNLVWSCYLFTWWGLWALHSQKLQTEMSCRDYISLLLCLFSSVLHYISTLVGYLTCVVFVSFCGLLFLSIVIVNAAVHSLKPKPIDWFGFMYDDDVDKPKQAKQAAKFIKQHVITMLWVMYPCAVSMYMSRVCLLSLVCIHSLLQLMFVSVTAVV